MHGVMICDVVPRKNTKMENQCHVYLSGPTNWTRPNKATDERTTTVRTNELALFLLIGGNMVISLKYGIPKF
jgi:hypothetical protein